MAKAVIYRDINCSELECLVCNKTTVELKLQDGEEEEPMFFYLNKADLINLASDLTMLSKQLQPDGADSNDNKA